MSKFRKCFVLRERLIPMQKLKKGDVFRLSGDKNCPEGYQIADRDAVPLSRPKGNCSVTAHRIEFIDHKSLPLLSETPIFNRKKSK